MNNSEKWQSIILLVINRILLIMISMLFGWYAGLLIACGFISTLKYFGLDDNLFRLLDAISLF